MSNLDKMTIDQLSKATGKERKSLFMFLRMQGIKLEDHPALDDVAVRQFSHPETAEVAYLLGYLWADGHVRSDNEGVILDCVKEDMDSIEPIFDSTGRWRKMDMNRKGKRASRIFRVYQKSLCQFLLSVGYGRKSRGNQDAIIALIPITLQRFFWRGYFDGDGCVYLSDVSAKTSIAGSFEQDWSTWFGLLGQLGIHAVVRKRPGITSSSTISVEALESQAKLLSYLYDGYETDQIGLKRKADKAAEVIKRQKQRKVSDSGYIGVYPMPKGGFFAKISIGSGRTKRILHLGTFIDPKDGALAFDKKARELRGSKARLNFPDQVHVAL